MTIEKNIPLKAFTTFHIGGAAEYFVRVHSIDEVREAIEFAKKENLAITILGGGSNVLIDDAGIRGLVIKIELSGIALEGDTLTVGAGESWDAVVACAVSNDLSGIENLSGIPGTVGGAVVQNIGAYGQALSQTLLWAEVYDTSTLEKQTFSNSDLQSGYRDSIFKRTPNRYVVLRAALGLSRIPKPDVSYKDLAARFSDATPTLEEVRAAVLEIRSAKFPDLDVEGTAGSFFKNPILSLRDAKVLQEMYPELPLFPLPESSGVKIPLGWFLDYRHGVIDMRAVRVGGARMYEKQFLVIVAERNSSSNDVKELARIVQNKIFEVTKIKIEPEVAYM